MYNYIGIDVAKSSLQVYIEIKDENISIDNNEKSLKSLYSKLKKYYQSNYENLVFIFEPTGSYSSLLKHFCQKHNIYCLIVNPRQSSNFAKALDNRSKSDIIDAKMLYTFHVMINTKDIAIPIIDPIKESIGEYMSYYKLLQKQRNSLINHKEALSSKNGDKFIIKKLEKQIKQLKDTEKSLVNKMLILISHDDILLNKFNNIKTIKGIGDLSAIALMHLFLAYPDANNKQITALAGLDSIEQTSGTSVNKKARISKRGNTIYRSLLFMPVLSAIRSNPYITIFYDRLKSNGKHSTVAQIAVMKKLILIAHSLYKNDVEFDNKLYEKRISYNFEDIA
jgi:transposase